MTDHIQIGDVSPSVQYQADGAQCAFPFPFPVFAAGDVEVWLASARQTYGFTVSGAGLSGGGIITFAVPPAAGTVVTLRRQLAVRRLTDFQEGGAFRAKVINDELDYQTAVLQQLQEVDARSVCRSPTSASTADLTLPEPLASRALKWKADGSGLENSAGDPDAQTAAAVASAAASAASATAAEAARSESLTAQAGAVAAHLGAVAAEANAQAAAASVGSYVKVSANDATAGPLFGKLTTGSGIAFTENNDGGNESLVIAVQDIYVAQGRHTIAVPATAMRPSKTGGCASLAEVTIGSGMPTRVSLDFDAATAETAEFVVPMPKSWNEGSLTAQFLWTQGITAAGDVVWHIEAQAISDADVLTTAFTGTSGVATDTSAGTVNRLWISAETNAFACGGSAQAGDLVCFRIYRNAAAVNDTLSVDALLLGVRLFYTVAAKDDA